MTFASGSARARATAWTCHLQKGDAEMTQVKSWQEVGKKFDTLGTHLRARLDEAGKGATADRAALEKTFKALLTAVEDSLDAASKVVTDPSLRREFTELATSMRDALLDALETFRAQTLTAARRRVHAGGTALRRVNPPKKGTAKRAPAQPVAHRAAPRAASAGKVSAGKARKGASA